MKKDKKGRPQDSKQKMQSYVKHLDEETKDEVRSSRFKSLKSSSKTCINPGFTETDFIENKPTPTHQNTEHLIAKFEDLLPKYQQPELFMSVMVMPGQKVKKRSGRKPKNSMF